MLTNVPIENIKWKVKKRFVKNKNVKNRNIISDKKLKKNPKRLKPFCLGMKLNEDKVSKL